MLFFLVQGSSGDGHWNFRVELCQIELTNVFFYYCSVTFMLGSLNFTASVVRPLSKY